jgi:hypothetical protein
MTRGKKHTAEQIVNLLRQVEVGSGEWQDVAAGVQGSRDRRADVLPLAQGVVVCQIIRTEVRQIIISQATPWAKRGNSSGLRRLSLKEIAAVDDLRKYPLKTKFRRQIHLSPCFLSVV